MSKCYNQHCLLVLPQTAAVGWLSLGARHCSHSRAQIIVWEQQRQKILLLKGRLNIYLYLEKESLLSEEVTFEFKVNLHKFSFQFFNEFLQLFHAFICLFLSSTHASKPVL